MLMAVNKKGLASSPLSSDLASSMVERTKVRVEMNTTASEAMA